MKYLIISILILIGADALAQIQPYQIRGREPKPTLWILGTDTVSVSAKYGLGMWYEFDNLMTDTSYVDGADLVIISTDGDTTIFEGGGVCQDTFYINEGPAGDTLVLVECDGDSLEAPLGGIGGSDEDWLKVSDNTVPDNLDTMYHMGPATVGDSNMYTGILNVMGRIDQRFKTSNIAIGNLAGNTAMSGSNNVAIGNSAMDVVTSGVTNVAIGQNALGTLTTGSSNFAIGTGALNGITTSSGNTAIGTGAGTITSGSANIFLGLNAGTGSTSVDRNVIIGNDAGGGGGIVDQNVFVGAESGSTNEGSNNVFIGYQSGGQETGSQKLYIENTDATEPLIYGEFDNDKVFINGQLGYSIEGGDATTIAGRDASEYFTNVGTGWGIDLTSGDLVVDSSQVATQYDITQIGGASDGNGIFDAANEGDTAEVVIVNVDPALGFYFQRLGGTDYWGYEPSAGHMIMSSTQNAPVVELNNTHATQGTWINYESAYNAGITAGVTPRYRIASGAIEAFEIENTPTVDLTLQLQADGDVRIADYPNTRDDGSPTNVLGTDPNGVVQSYPVADVGGGAGDDWGSDFVNTDNTLTGDGTAGDVLKVDTTIIATLNDLVGIDTDTDDQGLTLTGTGPYTIDIDNGSDVVIAASTNVTLTESPANQLNIAVTNEAIQDVVGPMVDPGNTETGITVTYDDAGNMFDFVVTDASTTNELSVVKVDNAAVSAGPPVLDFSSTDFGVAESPTDEFQLTVQPERIQDLVGAMLSGNTETNIAVTYQDGDGTIDFVAVDDQSLTFDGGSGPVGLVIDDGVGVDFIEGSGITLTSTATTMTISSTGGSADHDWYELGTTTAPNAITDAMFHTGEVMIGDNDDPDGLLHLKGNGSVDLTMEELSDIAEIVTKSNSNGTVHPFSLAVQNKDVNIDLTGNYYPVAEIRVDKKSGTAPGGTIEFHVSYDTLAAADQVLTIHSRENASASDGYVNIVGGLQYKWEQNGTTSLTCNYGQYGISMTNAATKTITLPVITTTGKCFEFFNDGAGTLTVNAGAGNTLHGDNTVLQNESIRVEAVTATKWSIK